ncbi:unnamed protein product [Amoebophrya sp. A120]|nr:unnamed protein product [Amoebophrya sp. A120]|eukprot:GSA120T00021738001.1
MSSHYRKIASRSYFQSHRKNITWAIQSRQQGFESCVNRSKKMSETEQKAATTLKRKTSPVLDTEQAAPPLKTKDEDADGAELSLKMQDGKMEKPPKSPPTAAAPDSEAMTAMTESVEMIRDLLEPATPEESADVVDDDARKTPTTGVESTLRLNDPDFELYSPVAKRPRCDSTE